MRQREGLAVLTLVLVCWYLLCAGHTLGQEVTLGTGCPCLQTSALTDTKDTEGGCILPGQPITGSIDVVGDTDTFTFYGYAGQGVSIEMGEQADDISFSPRLQLYDPNGKRVYATWGSSTARIEDYRLPATGIYTVVAGSYYPAAGKYSFCLAVYPGPIFTDPCDQPPGDITLNRPITATIYPGDLDGYRFFGMKGQGVAIEMGEQAGDISFSPRLQLYDPNGKRVYATWGSSTARIEDYRLPATGIYTVVAGSYYVASGTYGLSVSAAPPIDTRGLYPTGPTPADGSSVICNASVLAWQPVKNASSYDVYLAAGACSPLELIAKDVPGPSVHIGSLTAKGIYCWQVVAHTPDGDVKGPIWWFCIEPCQECTLTTVAIGNGTVVADPQGPTYPCGQQVQVIATAGLGYKFIRWQGSAVDAGKTMVNGPAAIVTVDGNYTLEAVFEPAPPVLQVLYDFPLDTNPGWHMDGQWQFGRPLGQGGQQYGNPDPSRGRTGQNVFGVNLSGDYVLTVGGPYCLTAGPFDLSTARGTRLRFFRWLNTDEPAYVRSAVEVSVSGIGGRTVWTPLWEHTERQPITDKSWVQQDLDLSLADGTSNVYIRWLYEVRPGAYPYSGWNIDDVQLVGYIATNP